MAYSTGSASTMAEVLTALINACTSDGWTWDSGEETLHKSGCYVRLQSFEDVDVDPRLEVLGRTSVDGSDGGDAPTVVAMRTMGKDSYYVPISFPATYYIFTFTAEVFLVLQYGDVHQWCAFGQSSQDGLSGTGNWVGATAGEMDPGRDNVSNYSPTPIDMTSSTGGDWYPHVAPALAWRTYSGADNDANFWIHTDFDAYPWSTSENGNGGGVGIQYATELVETQPNEITGESVLLPIRAYKNRPSSKISQVLEVENARHIRVDNYTAGQILTLGTDEWMVFPWYVKNTDNPDGGNNITHTGTFGWAIKYEGP